MNINPDTEDKKKDATPLNSRTQTEKLIAGPLIFPGMHGPRIDDKKGLAKHAIRIKRPDGSLNNIDEPHSPRNGGPLKHGNELFMQLIVAKMVIVSFIVFVF